MSFINFDEAIWASVEGIELCDSGGPGNTLTDPTTGVSFIIGEGSMEVMSTAGGDRILFFSRVDCTDTVLPTTTLVIRFDTPQEYVRFRVYPDPVGDAIMIVNYYDTFGAMGLLDSRTVPIAYLTPAEVTYSAPEGVREITIRTQAAENRFYEIEFYESMAEIRHDISLALDGSGSMQTQNKWGAMIEAADIFHDLYREFGHSDDGFGAVRFRWDCTDILAGDETVSQPALNPLSVDVDLPALYGLDSPAGCTPVGEGVIQAAGMTSVGVNPAKHLLLLTDGKNNRGRSVTSASADAALAGVTVHTLGLGSGVNIDPVEINALASEHGGTFRQTTDASEVLDFFAQTLGEMLGSVETAIVTGDMVTIAPGTDKAVFLIAWEDVASNHNFNLTTPGGVSIDHAAIPTIPGMSVSYHASEASNAHSYFVAQGDISGTWEFSSVPLDTQRIVLEDLDVTVEWTVTPQLGQSGDIIVIEARVLYKGKPFEGIVNVRADVIRPDESQGDLVASEQLKKPVVLQASGDVSQRAQIISGVLGRFERHDFLYDADNDLSFDSIGEGRYRLEYDATEYDGVYRFNLEAEGLDEKNNLVFGRRTNRFCTLVNAVDGSESQLEVLAQDKNIYRVTVTPVNHKGAYIGPFLAEHLRITTPQAVPLRSLKDNLDGTYTQLFRADTVEPKDFSVGMFTQSVPLNAEEELPTGRLPWIIILILIVLLIISLFV